ncbi:TMEM175 family protein [Cryobacterium sp. 10C3]|uniref:TMEM175 family protein n=1 Tax=Cryobacterium sp. 10C3 TaxID=3048577 RepID=UPI002AB3C0EA|nr:TMEM175 family protein [Cryobacterium sp. 10C3]MDY7558935.1 TMEM175 family protein [Cryobacterium sp. 10C3]
MRGLDRLIFFTDAIAAIAITLLILPLADLVPLTPTDVLPGDFLLDHLSELLAFLLSFAVIARLWIAHHSLFEHVSAYSPALRNLSLLWAFTIVVLPLPTAMVAHWSNDSIVVGFYIGTMFVSSLLLTSMTILTHRAAALQEPTHPLSSRTIIASVLTTAEFLVALILGTVFQDINYWGLFALFLSTPILLITRMRRTRAIIRA